MSSWQLSEPAFCPFMITYILILFLSVFEDEVDDSEDDDSEDEVDDSEDDSYYKYIPFPTGPQFIYVIFYF